MWPPVINKFKYNYGGSRDWSPVTNYLEVAGYKLASVANIKFGAFLFPSGAFCAPHFFHVDQILSWPAFGTFCCKNWTIFHNIYFFDHLNTITSNTIT